MISEKLRDANDVLGLLAETLHQSKAQTEKELLTETAYRLKKKCDDIEQAIKGIVLAGTILQIPSEEVGRAIGDVFYGSELRKVVKGMLSQMQVERNQKMQQRVGIELEACDYYDAGPLYWLVCERSAVDLT